MSDPITIYSSLMGANLLDLGGELARVEAGGADGILIDVMDGHSTPYITFGPMVVEHVRRATSLRINVYLMIEKPERFISQFAMAGADRIFFDVGVDNPPATIDGIREAGKLVGISLRTTDPVDEVLPYIDFVDTILVLSSDPSARGHPFMPRSLEKLEALRQSGFTGEVAVYGGINEKSSRTARAAGASVLVAGTHIFSGGDPKARIAELRGAAAKG